MMKFCDSIWGGADQHTVYEAELVGILLALRLIETQKINYRVAVATDNQAAIMALNTRRPKPGSHIIGHIRTAYEKLVRKKPDLRISFIWRNSCFFLSDFFNYTFYKIDKLSCVDMRFFDAFLEVFLGGKWQLLNASNLQLYDDYLPSTRILPGNRYAYDKGADPRELVLSPDWER